VPKKSNTLIINADRVAAVEKKMMTYFENPTHVKETWHLVNADGKTLGRLAARVAGILRGKHRPTFTPNVDMGDHVVIVNAE